MNSYFANVLTKPMNKSTRRDFLRHMAALGLLLPTANALLGHRAYAQGTAKRVIFFYYPNGMVKEQWQPTRGAGSISNGTDLSFSLQPLRNHLDKVVVCKNMYLTAIPGGGHDESAQNIMAAKGGLSDQEATVDHILAEALNSRVVNLGVRTGREAQIMVSKPRNVGNANRLVPVNDPKAAADQLFAGLGEENNGDNALREQMLDAVLADINELKSISLQGAPKTKVEEHERALAQIKANIERSFGDCGLVKTTVTDPYKDGATADNYAHFQHIPTVARAQIDNAVGALACGVSKVVTLQMFKGNENPNLANYSFDEGWANIQAAASVMGVQPLQRWYNEHSSHTASHVHFVSHAGQSRWYVQLYAYLLDQLAAFGILEDTLAVMLSEVGDGNDHGPLNGGVIVGGGTGGALQTGRIVDCNNQRSTQQLFVDLGTLLGVNVQGQNGWGGGGAIV